jgi:transposase-like protein
MAGIHHSIITSHIPYESEFKRTQNLLAALDETLIQIYGKAYWLWIAHEPNIKRCLRMHVSRERTILVYYQFFEQLRSGLDGTLIVYILPVAKLKHMIL